MQSLISTKFLIPELISLWHNYKWSGHRRHKLDPGTEYLFVPNVSTYYLIYCWMLIMAPWERYYPYFTNKEIETWREELCPMVLAHCDKATPREAHSEPEMAWMEAKWGHQYSLPLTEDSSCLKRACTTLTCWICQWGWCVFHILVDWPLPGIPQSYGSNQGPNWTLQETSESSTWKVAYIFHNWKISN